MKKLSKKAFTLGLLILLAVIAFIAGIFFYRQKDADAKKDPYGFTTISLEELFLFMWEGTTARTAKHFPQSFKLL